MTLEQFKANFRYTFIFKYQGNANLIIVSEVIRRSDNKVVDSIKTTIDVPKNNDWIFETQSLASVNSWDWTGLIDQAKRIHLCYFSQRAQIEGLYPLNPDKDPDILHMYNVSTSAVGVQHS